MQSRKTTHAFFNVKPYNLIDPLDFMAKAYEQLGQYDKAIETMKRVIVLLEEEYGITTGEMVEKPKREIDKLRKKK